MRVRSILWPFSLLYGAVTGIRNYAFDHGWLKSEEFEIPVISVGNLSTGGTGKTPMVEFLIRNLKDYKIGFVSRGYGRKTKGLITIHSEHTPSEIGDEPYQIYRKNRGIAAAVSEKRGEGIEALIRNSRPEIIILDDAFQHRYVKPQVNILLTTYRNPYFSDLILPAGNLREHSSGKSRADIVVVTKCPSSISKEQRDNFIKKLKLRPRQEIFFSGLTYNHPRNAGGEVFETEGAEIIAVTGIANPDTFIQQLESQYRVREHWKFPDHHSFSEGDIKKIQQAEYPIITTEKDWVRLTNLLSEESLRNVYYIPIEVKMLFEDGLHFTEVVKSHLYQPI